ncbi:UNVERIFIED_CONTAM: hypothetical protein GTU68_013180 [Idotea baltica]|nr:hypothetical protein [Idotea baltica]
MDYRNRLCAYIKTYQRIYFCVQTQRNFTKATRRFCKVWRSYCHCGFYWRINHWATFTF